VSEPDASIDWLAWHAEYDDPASRLSQRLAIVQSRLRDEIDRHPGALRITSMCAGQGRDVIGVLADHPRRDDVSAVLVELDPRLTEIARRDAAAAGLSIDVHCADASLTTTYDGVPPADILLACGIFGNISDDDIRRCIDHLPMLCAPGASVLWTRATHPARDVPGMVRAHFATTGFEEIAFDASDATTFRVGVNRLIAPPRPFEAGLTMFEFRRGREGYGA
jgi:hypothetical protein